MELLKTVILNQKQISQRIDRIAYQVYEDNVKQGFSSLEFDKVGKKEFELYVSGVQKAAEKDYRNMEKFIKSIFPK